MDHQLKYLYINLLSKKLKIYNPIGYSSGEEHIIILEYGTKIIYTVWLKSIYGVISHNTLTSKFR